MKKGIASYVIYILVALLIPIAFTSAAGLDFGGRIIKAVPCTCSPYVRITFISSQGKTAGTPMSLDYLYFSQMFSKYNLPVGRQLIGKYIPVPKCLDFIGFACKPRVIEDGAPPALGTITPFVGSSL